MRASRVWPAIRVTLRQTSARPGTDGGPLTAEDRLLLQLDDLGPSAIESPAPDEWLVHFAEAPDLERITSLLEREFGAGTACTLEWIPDEDWAARTQAQLRAITVGRVIVAPPWDRPASVEPGQLVIEIEPSTGFGTGHHQSTRLCLHALQRESRPGLSVLDVGTGSGVLAIAAAFLGCAPVDAIDMDPDACRSALENVTRNGVADTVQVAVEGLGERPRSAALVLANLTADVICHHAAALGAATAIGGKLIVSGIMRSQVPLVLEALAALTTVGIDEEEDWVAITMAS